MRKLIIKARPSGYRRWSAVLEWYPSQTNNFGWQTTTIKLSGGPSGGKAGSSVVAQLLCARLAYWIKQAGEAETFTRR